MIFPAAVTTKHVVAEDSAIKRSFKFNYKTGQFELKNGALVETTEVEAIAQWLELLVRTRLDLYAVYNGTKFGHSAERYIGYRTLPLGFAESEFQREIEDAAKLNPGIEAIHDFKVKRTTRGLDVTFTARLKNRELIKVVGNVEIVSI